MTKLGKSFYLNPDTLWLAKSLLGKKLCTSINGFTASGIISETEAYLGAGDRASHAHNNRRTPRTDIMFREGGISYVYLCYGIHCLFNVVTGNKDYPHAILIRSVIPADGIAMMMQRRKTSIAENITSGPGNLTKALGINLSHNAISLTGKTIWIEDAGVEVPAGNITTTTRIGVNYAGKDALLPFRFLLNQIHSS